MSKLKEIKKALGKILFNFEEVTVEDITYVYEKLEVGEPIYVFNDEGEKEAAPDATIEIEGSTVVIKDGKIESIEPIEPKEEEEVVEEALEGEEEVVAVVEEVVEEVIVETIDPVIVELQAQVAGLETRLYDLEVRLNEIVNILNDTVLAVEDFSAQPVAKKIESKFSSEKNREKKLGAGKYFGN